jgi:Arc/MetJ-type ribon-helix-helix transcriptional regulator
MEEKYIPTNIRLTEEQYERLRDEAHETRKSQAEIIREALELRWAQKEKEGKKMVYSVQKPDDYDSGTFLG